MSRGSASLNGRYTKEKAIKYLGVKPREGSDTPTCAHVIVNTQHATTGMCTKV